LEKTPGQSKNLLAIKRFGQSRLCDCSSLGGPELPTWSRRFDFSSPVQHRNYNRQHFTLISGGKPITIHAKSRYQVQEIVDGTEAIAAVDGAFSLKYLNSMS